MTHFAFTPDLSSWTNQVQTLCDSVPLKRSRSYWTWKLRRQITSASKTCASRRRATTEPLCSWRKSRFTASFQSTTFIAAVLSSFWTSPSAVFSTTNELSRSSRRRSASWKKTTTLGTWLLKAQCSRTALCWKKKETTRRPRSSCLRTTSSTRLSTLASSRLRQELKFLRKPLGKRLNGNAQLKNPQSRKKVGFTRDRTKVLYVYWVAATLPLTNLTWTRRQIWANFPTWTFQSQYWAPSQS